MNRPAANPFVRPTSSDDLDAHPANDDLTHIVCCLDDPETAMCGYVIKHTDTKVTVGLIPKKDRCVVCDAMANLPCPACGW